MRVVPSKLCKKKDWHLPSNAFEYKGDKSNCRLLFFFFFSFVEMFIFSPDNIGGLESWFYMLS